MTNDHQPPSNGRSLPWETITVILLLLILILGAYFRFTGLNWDNETHLHPDERFLTSTTSRLQPVESLRHYFSPSESTLSPYVVGEHFYVYGNFPMTVTRYVAEWVNNYCETRAEACAYNYTSYTGVHLVGRFLSGLIDLSSVLFIFLIGMRLYSRRVGLLAAFFQTTAVLSIQQSHFYTMDTWAAALATMTLYTAVRAARFGDDEDDLQWRWYILFGLGLGLTVASRINVAPLAPMIGVAGLIWLVRRGRASLANDLLYVLVAIVIAAGVALATFRVAQPYAFADHQIARETILAETGYEPGPVLTSIFALGFNPQWRANMDEIRRLQEPEASWPPALQWTGRPAIIFPWTNMVLYGMGLLAGLAAWGGFFWALWRIATFRPDWTAHLIPLIWSGGYFLFMGTRWVKSIRYMLPIYPTLLLLAAWALWLLWQYAGQNQTAARRLKQAGAAALILVTMSASLLWANAFVSTVYGQPLTRNAASEWIYEHVPTGATLFYEAEGQARQLQLPLREFTFVPGGGPLALPFELPVDGVVTAVQLNYLSVTDPNELGQAIELHFYLNDGPVIEQTISVTESRQSSRVDLPPTRLLAGVQQRLVIQPEAGVPVLAETSRTVNEHWDDLLPTNVGGRGAYTAYYMEVAGGQRPVTHPDDPDKRETVAQWLDEADYIFISSQRAIWSLPRLPLTYPLMVRYYESLFSGELGFDLVHQQHDIFRIGPLYISDTAGKARWGQPPDVGWPPPGALAAEEAFSVYDHPPVWIFAKRDDFSREQMLQVLGSVDLNNQVTMNPLQATQAPNAMMLTTAQQAIQQAGGSFSELFNPDGLSQRPWLAAVVWWLAVIGLGWLAFPLTFVVLCGLPDRGYPLARILGLLVVSYFGWIMASLNWLPFTRGTLLWGTAVLALLSLAFFWRHRAEMVGFVRRNLAYIGLVEGLALLLFLLMIGVRLGNPDVWDVIWGGEKPMDLSYYTAVLKSTSFPPYDPWFAGGYINYYYYGFVYVGVLALLLGIIPAVAYNLILPMLFSFVGLGLFCLAYNLVVYQRGQANGRLPLWSDKLPLLGGGTAVLLGILLGNLAQIRVIANAWYRTGSSGLEESLPVLGTLLRTLDGGLKMMGGQSAPMPTGDWFWLSSRAISINPGEVQPITEFPFFTFLYGDLHAHMISMPLMLLALGWGVALVLQNGGRWTADGGRWRSSRFETAVQWGVGAIAIGVFQATNTWDLPTFIVLGVLAVIYATYLQDSGRQTIDDRPQIPPSPIVHGPLSMVHRPLSIALQSLYKSGLLIGLALLAFWPFGSNYGTAYTSLSLWPGSYTPVSDYLVIYGLFLFLVVTHLAREFRAWTGSWTQEQLVKWRPAAPLVIVSLILYVIIILLLYFQGYAIAPIVLTLIIVAGLLGLRPSLPPARRILLILISSALGLTLLVEIFVLDGDVGRMNTVFKFYIQVWLILSVAGGAALAAVWPTVWNGRRFVWLGVLGLLIFLAALYPLTATPAKWEIRMSKEAPRTLNGMAFIEYVHYGDTDYTGQPQRVHLADDYEAIHWMWRNIDGSPVVAEAHSGNPYRSIGSRISMYTGLPTIVGWDWHQRQQRSTTPDSLVGNRASDVNRLYHTTDVNEALVLLEKYDVSYVYVGQLEWTYYNPEGLNKFDRMVDMGYLEEVYRNPGTSIYRVIRE
jgi:YYY domain-containing protein